MSSYQNDEDRADSIGSNIESIGPKDDKPAVTIKFTGFDTESSSSSVVSSSFSDNAYANSNANFLSVSDNKRFPPELHRTLLEFVLAFIVEKPVDIIDYALKHFTRLQAKRRQLASAVPGEFDCADDSSLIGAGLKSREIGTRRKSVFAESYDPEEDIEECEYVEKTPEQLERLWNSIKNLVIFRSLDEEEKDQILNAMFEKRVVEGQTIIKQGDDGDFFYVIESGRFRAVKDGVDVYYYNNTGIFGELALLYNTKRAATVISMSDGLLWCLDRATFRRILLSGAFKKRKVYNDLLLSVPMFSVLDDYERMKVADALTTRFFKKGDAIVKQGDAGDGMYFVEEGRVSVYVDRGDGKKNQLVTKIQKGQYFGELALLTYEPRRATAIADCEVKTAFLDKDSFERLLGKCVDVLNRGIEDYNLKDKKLVEYLNTSVSRMKGLEIEENGSEDAEKKADS